jgi:hypothetical protein
MIDVILIVGGLTAFIAVVLMELDDIYEWGLF